MNIAIIGAGISGIAAASILNNAGHRTTLFEKSGQAGGVWAVGYPGVSLRNTAHQYTLSQFPWPFKPALHPTGVEILKYLDLAIEDLGLFVQYGAPDYRHVFEEYFSQVGKRNAPLPSLPIHT